MPESTPGETQGVRGETGATGREMEEGEKKKKKIDLLHGLEFKGRVFARAAYKKISYPTSGTKAIDFSVPSGRFGLKYEAAKWMALVLEADIADKPLLRDAFVQAKSRHARGRMGQFKMPLSSITLESPWNLPIARRGTIQGLLNDRMRVVGRRPGLLGSARGGGWLDPELSLSVFQGAAYDDKGSLYYLKDAALDSHNEVVRVSGTPGGDEVALVATRVTTREGVEMHHFWAGGADTTIDHLFGSSGLRIWGEGLAGNVRYTRTLPDLTLERYTATYWEGRAIVAWRWGGLSDGERYIEPFAFAGLLDPDKDRSDDLIWEAFLGVNVGLWKQGRLTLQFERGEGGIAAPIDLFLAGQTIRAHTAVVLQAGAAF